MNRNVLAATAMAIASMSYNGPFGGSAVELKREPRDMPPLPMPERRPTPPEPKPDSIAKKYLADRRANRNARKRTRKSQKSRTAGDGRSCGPHDTNTEA